MLFFVLFCLAGNALFAGQMANTGAAGMQDARMAVAYKDFLTTIVPPNFIDTLYTMTENDYQLGLLVMGIGRVESDWRFMESHLPNKDGSIDQGPLGLNSTNLNNPDFMRRFASPEYADLDPYVYYMTICINLIRGLCHEYGDIYTALKVYNGGRRAIETDEACAKLSQRTAVYAERVQKHRQEISARWDDYVDSQAGHDDENLSDLQADIPIEPEPPAEAKAVSHKTGLSAEIHATEATMEYAIIYEYIYKNDNGRAPLLSQNESKNQLTRFRTSASILCWNYKKSRLLRNKSPPNF
jgi:hypothetical protein